MIVITAPTGSIGHQVLENVLASGKSVRVIVRDASRLSPQTRERVEVVEGSHSDLDVVMQAFTGADAVFWLVPPDPQTKSLQAAYLDFTRPACTALKSQAVKRVVSITALGRGTTQAGNAGLVTASLAMDDLLADTGVSLRAVTNPSFMDNILRQLEPLKTKGTFFSPIDGDLNLPTCATRDIAAVSAQLLLDSTWSGVGHAAVLGPEDLSANQMAQIMSEVLGTPVSYQQISFEAFKAQLVKNKMSEAFAQGYVDMMRAKNEGLDQAEPRTPENTTPTSFRQWCEEELKPAFLR